MRTCIATLVTALALVTLAHAAPQNNAREKAMPPYRAGLDHMQAEAFEQAAKSFQVAIGIDPTFEMAHYFLGRAYMPLKKYVEAAAAFAKTRELYIGATGRQFANVQEAQRYRRERVVEIDEVIRQVQSVPEAAQSAQMQHYLRQLTEQKRLLQESIQRGGDVTITTSVPAYVSLSLGSAYFRMGNLPEAEKAYREAIAADPNAGEAHNNLAVVYLETGRYKEAQRAVRAAEKAGMRVHPQLKADIAAKIKSN
jgi:tetratricopeptide (TPR) repeat protein